MTLMTSAGQGGRQCPRVWRGTRQAEDGRRAARRTYRVVPLVAVLVAACCSSSAPSAPGEAADRFETVRAHIDAWLSATSVDQLLVSAPDLKATVVDRWSEQKAAYQMYFFVEGRAEEARDDRDAGHVPGAVNVPWADIVSDQSLSRLDRDRTLILCCYYGHASMLSATILNLLGYRSQSLSFGMMGWNLEALVKPPWDQQADYEVETGVDEQRATFPLPTLASKHTDARELLREMAQRYLASEGSPVIASADLRTIVDGWAHSEADYQIVDVRSTQEYEAGHLPHALSLPLARLAATASLTRLDQDEP